MENELRLGNLFILRGKIVEFDDNLMHSVIYGGLEGSEPIPLTEECLLKFGFEKFVEHTPSFGHDDIYRKRYIDINGRYNQYHFRNILIESVHELQNLYFALTKEELTMK